MTTRPYQIDLIRAIQTSWADGNRNVVAVLPTGGGKTWIFTEIIKSNPGPCTAIAHRQEIVLQISMSFAKHGVMHKIIGPDNVVKLANQRHIEVFGRAFYDPRASVAVAGVDTLRARHKALAPWCKTNTLWVMDEAHHILRSNKWGATAEMFPNARGLGVTATPLRADGRGLGAWNDGVFDDMVIGPSLRELVQMGYLADYRIYAPPSDIDFSSMALGANGDWTRPSVKRAVRKSRVIGDVVTHYLKITPGRLGITFAPDVETAGDIAKQFNEAGVPAAVCTAKTPEYERVKTIQAFTRREYLQLVNVDLFGEGFDVPGVEVVSLARPTQSFAVFAQQCGRALRPDGDKVALIIDHVGNVERHARAVLENGRYVIDLSRSDWSLERRERATRKKPGDEIPVRACPACTAVYERIYRACPFCGFAPEPAARSGPEWVDGDLSELDPETLARMMGEVVDVTMSRADYLAKSGAGMLPQVAALGAANRFKEKQAAQVALRDVMALWAGARRAEGLNTSQMDRLFYFRFGIDKLSAQALGRKDAEELNDKVVIDTSVNT